MDITKCPMHPSTSGESQYGGYYCWGNVDGEKCKFAVKEFVNDTPDGGVEKVTKYHLPQPGRWLSKEDFISAKGTVTTASVRETAALQDEPFPPDDGDFGPHLADAPDATASPPEATLDRDRLIVRQVAAKCAVEALGPYPYASEDGEMRRWEGALLHLMATIEDNVYRSGGN